MVHYNHLFLSAFFHHTIQVNFGTIDDNVTASQLFLFCYSYGSPFSSLLLKKSLGFYDYLINPIIFWITNPIFNVSIYQGGKPLNYFYSTEFP